MKITVVACASYYGAGDSYEKAQLAASFMALGHDVQFIPIDIHHLLPHERYQLIADFAPDMLLFFPHETEVDPACLRAVIRCPLVLLLADDQWRRAFGLQMAAYADYVLAQALDSAQAYGAKYVPFEWGVYAPLWTGEPVARDIDVSFVGQNYGDRLTYLNALTLAGIDLFSRGIGYGGALSPQDMACLLRRSKISLNLSKASQGNVNAVKIRPFEIGASGAMILTEYAPGLENSFWIDTEAVFFATLSEMVDKARYYLTHDDERERIAAAGQARVLRDHTLDRRWAVLFEAMGI